MERLEAAAVLGIDEAAPATQARERARQLQTELTDKIGGAPTPSLRSSYQRKLQQVLEAGRVLGGDTIERANGDLPATGPQHTGADAEGGLPDEAVGASPMVADEPPKKSNKGKIIAGSAAAALAAGVALHALAGRAEAAPTTDAGEAVHHHTHDPAPEDDAPPQGNDDGILSAVLQELSTVDVEHVAADVAPPLESWMVIDDPHPPEMEDPAPVHQDTATVDPLDALTHLETGVQHITVDLGGPPDASVLDLTASAPSVEIVSPAHDHVDMSLFGGEPPRHEADDIDDD